ncbi:MAG: SDR family NAD(P)-dependent oxidoreductase [Lamprocystis purpurea]|jgi:NAD(P)-dependent dehydrogenase (short-subunit alcohol dehydrogenase family)|uniref:SDR family NAD(P)-dependent oxidoreductase n=1 Tax=Lamprocystis purpurea TaxID=61598 RepID=UPI00035FF378|nr:SDR family NAD(P)-dependent oxidoreductase [Lamprocystis purpurea]MBV5273086.1 SDR family NAD(P)-dependent oxidoreductase [Lamprocystis purpurea]
MKVPVCVIVGAGPGNGAAFARQFSRAGYRVALLARGRDSLDALTAEIAGTRAYTYDATDPADAERVFAAIRQDLGTPQTLIYNASTREFGDIDATTPDAFERAWKVNTYGCLLAAQQVIPDLRAAGQGSIVIIGATASLKGAAGFVAFASAKAAQRSLAQSLARQLGPQGIHVAYVVIDAVVDMPASRAMIPDAPDTFFARPDDIAESVFFLARQPRSAWTFELDLRPFGEHW